MSIERPVRQQNQGLSKNRTDGMGNNGEVRTLLKGRNTLKLRGQGNWSTSINKEVAQTADFNFVTFAQDPVYIASNNALLDKSFGEFAPDNGFIHLDVGGGTGLVVQESIKIAEQKGKRGRFIMVEPDEFAITSAFETTPESENASVAFIQGVGQEIEKLVRQEINLAQIDTASIHDAIHEIRGINNKRATIRGIIALLKPGGTLSINSAFTSIAQQDPGYGRWKFGAIKRSGGRRIRTKREEPLSFEYAKSEETAGEKGKLETIDQDDTKTAILQPQDYIDLLTLPESEGGLGLELISAGSESLPISQSALEGIAHYPRFAEGFFEDVEFDDGRVVTITDKINFTSDAVSDIQPRDGRIQLPRNWYNIIVRKPLELPHVV